MKKNIKIKIAVIVIAIITLIFVFSTLFFSYKTSQTTNNKVQSQPSLLKIGFITDWEYGTRKLLGTKMTRKAPVELSKIVFYLNEEFHPDVVVGGGDYIESSAVKPEDAKNQLKEINEIFSLIKAPRLYVLGNHDLRSLTKAEVRETLGIQENHEVKDIGDWRIVIFDTNFTNDGQHRGVKNYTGGSVSQEELDWLKEALKTDRTVLVFSHHSPIKSRNRQGNAIQNISNDQEVRNILEEAGNVVAVISGHNPTSYFERLNDINYFICDTMVNVNALGSFATIEVKYHSNNKTAEINFKQLGTKKHEYQTEWKWGEKKENYQHPTTEIDEFIEPDIE